MTELQSMLFSSWFGVSTFKLHKIQSTIQKKYPIKGIQILLSFLCILTINSHKILRSNYVS